MAPGAVGTRGEKGPTYDATEDELLIDGAHEASPVELPRHAGGVRPEYCISSSSVAVAGEVCTYWCVDGWWCSEILGTTVIDDDRLQGRAPPADSCDACTATLGLDE